MSFCIRRMSFCICYSDHNEDIRTKGWCDYCEGEDPQ